MGDSKDFCKAVLIKERLNLQFRPVFSGNPQKGILDDQALVGSEVLFFKAPIQTFQARDIVDEAVVQPVQPVFICALIALVPIEDLF